MTRPVPTPADKARAEAMFLEDAVKHGWSPEWIAQNRASSIKHYAMAIMAKRQNAEWKQKFAVKAPARRAA